MAASKVKLGFIPANRGFFSDKLAADMRARTLRALKAAGAGVVVPAATDTKVGCVESLEEALKVGRMFRDQRVEGIVVSAVNFGDEQGVALAIRESGLKVPILIFGCQESETLTPTSQRRDSFCGLLSIGDALRQLDLPYSVPETPICYPEDESFTATLGRFLSVCRVVNGIRHARYAQVGARPDAFWTCRYSEKALQALGVTIVSLDLSEVIGAVGRLKTDAAVRRVVADMKRSLDCSAVADPQLEKMAKFELVLRRLAAERQLDGLGVQCWTSLQQNLGICACSTLSRLDDRGLPSACEADMLGTLSMHALQLAGGGPAALADWNNLHNDDLDLVNCWHCGVFPASWAKGQAKLGCQEIIAGSVGRDSAMGVVEFVMDDGPVTMCRATQDSAGRHKMLVVQGSVEPSAAATFGTYGWVRIGGLQRLYRNVLLRHFPHHVALSRGQAGNVLWEAFGNYLGFDVYAPGQESGQWTPQMPFEA